MSVLINPDECTACESCVAACPLSVIEMSGGVATVGDSCTLCGACVDACAFGAITMPETTTAPADDTSRGVWVFIEHWLGAPVGVSYELLSKGRELADSLNTELVALAPGVSAEATGSLIAQGANRVLRVAGEKLNENHEDYLHHDLVKLIREHQPEIFLAGATALGRALIPRVAATLNTGLTADCTGLEIDTGKRLLLQTRPTFGGNIMATIICPQSRPQMATVRPRIFKKAAPNTGRTGEVVYITSGEKDVSSDIHRREFISEMAETIKIEEADIIVAGGRGLGKPENFGMLKELASLLGGAVASSRPPVDDGWLPYHHQVGQTGKTISPKLYIACGISGAVQHLAGMQTADVIVAINDDPNAPIFDIANYGIVGDVFTIIPMIIEQLKARG
ncbi:FAD-binding protein [Chloroflexota bacterium]